MGRQLWIRLVGLALITALTGCASFSDRDDAFVRDHINLWPVYVRGGDDHGWVAPLIRVNPETRSGHVRPLVWWSPERTVGFPVYWRHGQAEAWDGRVTWIAPFWREQIQPGGHYFRMLLPFAIWSDNAKERVVFVIPFYLHVRLKQQPGEFAKAICYPFYMDFSFDGVHAQSLLPFYARFREVGKPSSFVSLPYTDLRDPDDGGRTRLVAMLWYTSDHPGQHRRGPIVFIHGTGDDGRTNSLHTPLVGWNSVAGKAYWYPLTPLLGVRSGDRFGGWVWPLFSLTGRDSDGWFRGKLLWGRFTGGHDGLTQFTFFPLVHYASTGRFQQQAEGFAKARTDLRLLGLYRQGSDYLETHDQVLASSPDGQARLSIVKGEGWSKEWRLWPLASYQRTLAGDRQRASTRANLLCWLYRYEYDLTPSGEHVHHDLLEWLFQVDRQPHHTRVDLLPGISWHAGDDYLGWSLCWRLLRYENLHGRRSADLLFLPILRPGDGS